MKLASILVTVTLVMLLAANPAGAGVQDFVGSWRHTILSEDDASTLACRTINVTTRQYLLTSDGSHIVGSYSRMERPLWLGFTTQCDYPSTAAVSAQRTRSDWWSVRGTVDDSGHLRLAAEHNRCLGACVGEGASQTFSTILSLTRDSLLDDDPETGVRRYFVPEDITLGFEKEASERFMSLLNPLLDGSCTAFVEESLDNQYKITMSLTELCMVADQLSILLQGTIADSNMVRLYFDNAILLNHAQQEPWSIGGGGNVLVERLMILDAQGNGLPLAAILRRQLSGEWKIISLTP